MNDATPLRYAIIGSGAMGQEHIRYLNLIDNCSVTAIADPDDGMRNSAASLAPEAITCTAYQDLLDSDNIDAWVLATPNHTHIDVMPDLLATNKPVLLEKPMCTTVDDCNRLIDMARQSRSIVWVAMEYRYMSPVADLIKRVHSGEIGTLRMLTIREHRFPFLVKVDDWNRFSANTGGTLVEKCCHFFDLMRLIIRAEPVRVYASGNQDVNHLEESYNGVASDILDNAYVIVDFDNGSRAMLEICMFAEGQYYQETVTAVGDSATLTAQIPRAIQFEKHDVLREASVTLADRHTGLETQSRFSLDKDMLEAGAHFGSTYHEHLGFAQCIRSGSQPTITLLDGLRAVQIGAAAEQSTHTHQVIDLNFSS